MAVEILAAVLPASKPPGRQSAIVAEVIYQSPDGMGNISDRFYCQSVKTHTMLCS